MVRSLCSLHINRTQHVNTHTHIRTYTHMTSVLYSHILRRVCSFDRMIIHNGFQFYRLYNSVRATCMTDVLEKLPKMQGERNMWGSRKLNPAAAHSNQDNSPTAARYNPLYIKPTSAIFGLSFSFSLSVFPRSLVAVVK